MALNRKVFLDILRLGLPILVGQVGTIVTGFADTIMVGHYTTEALASASFVNNLYNVVLFACVGFTYGVTPLVGALYAQKRPGEIGAIMRTALLANLLFSMVITVGMAVLYFYLDRLGQPAELLPTIRPYYLLYLGGIIPVAVFNVFAQWSYAVNNTKMPMWIILGANGLNILGNWLLIYGHFGLPELGLTGAGISTLAARLLCGVVIVAIFLASARNRDYRAGFWRPTPAKGRFKAVNRTSWPVAMQMTFESGSFSAAAIMTGWLGAIPLAAFQVCIIVGMLGFCIYYSMGAAVSVLVSNAAGCNDRAGMRTVAGAGYIIILTLAAISSCIFVIGGRPLMHLFTDDPAVLAVAVSLLFPLVLYQLGDATQITFANALRGTGHVMPMLWISFASYVVVGLPATWLLGFPAGLGVYGILLSFSVSLFMAAGLFMRHFLKVTKAPNP